MTNNEEKKDYLVAGARDTEARGYGCAKDNGIYGRSGEGCEVDNSN